MVWIFTFVPFVQLKNYIALFFVVIFIGKLATIDSNFFELLMNSSEVTVVNKMCPKKQLLKNSSDKISISSKGEGIEMNFLCHSLFDHEIMGWESITAQNNFQTYSYRSPRIFSPPGDKFYPPPKG